MMATLTLTVTVTVAVASVVTVAALPLTLMLTLVSTYTSTGMGHLCNATAATKTGRNTLPKLQLLATNVQFSLHSRQL